MQMRGEWPQRQNLNHAVMIIPNNALFGHHLSDYTFQDLVDTPGWLKAQEYDVTISRRIMRLIFLLILIDEKNGAL
jgi:hypothetical protein